MNKTEVLALISSCKTKAERILKEKTNLKEKSKIDLEGCIAAAD